GAENRLILDELQFGSEKNWVTRNSFLEAENFPNLRVLADFFSFKAESKVSFFQYNEYFSKWEEFQAKSVHGLSHDLRNYMRFKGNYFSLKKYDNLEALIFHESSASIIDRYIFVIRILQHHFESNDAGESNVLINSITRLSDKIEDISLVNLLLMVTPN